MVAILDIPGKFSSTRECVRKPPWQLTAAVASVEAKLSSPVGKSNSLASCGKILWRATGCWDSNVASVDDDVGISGLDSDDGLNLFHH